MLNLFPLTFLAPLAYTLLRIVLGGVCIYLGNRHLGAARRALSTKLKVHVGPSAYGIVWFFGGLELLAGIMLLIGFYTQAAALIILMITIVMLLLGQRIAHPTIPQRMTYILIGACALSLFITGAGALAFDLPI